MAPFWLHFEPRGAPGDPLESLCVAPVPQDPPKCDFGAILGAPWDPFWHPFGTGFGSGPALDTLGVHFGSIFGAFGSLSVSTLFLNLKNDRKLTFFRVVDVAEV